jgi:hypothetical protein
LRAARLRQLGGARRDLLRDACARRAQTHAGGHSEAETGAGEIMSDDAFILKIERAHFRTDDDTGANPAVMMIWNLVRQHFGKPPLTIEELPAFCTTHQTYHKIAADYGCRRKDK